MSHTETHAHTRIEAVLLTVAEGQMELVKQKFAELMQERKIHHYYLGQSTANQSNTLLAVVMLQEMDTGNVGPKVPCEGSVVDQIIEAKFGGTCVSHQRLESGFWLLSKGTVS